jgi:CheY-like chemotaxis protein
MTRSLRIAVADDERDTRDFLKKALERLGHIVLGPVENGALLVELCLQSLPDLVVTDIRMPELNGDEALRHIHAVHPVPCIVLSAFGDAGKLLSQIESNCVFLGKPFRKSDLHAAIEQLTSAKAG